MMHKIDWHCFTITALCSGGVTFAILWPETAQVSSALWSIAAWAWYMVARRTQRELDLLAFAAEISVTPYWHFTMASPFAPASPETPGQPDQTGHHAAPEPLSPPAAPRQPQ